MQSQRTMSDFSFSEFLRATANRLTQSSTIFHQSVVGKQSIAKNAHWRLAWTISALIAILLIPEAAPTAAQQLSSQPVLQLETGMHAAPIQKIGTDAAGKYLVTASDDKTARVWDLATGKLLRVLRPPLGAGREGELYSCALSPDGTIVAVGGYTTAGEPSANIYLFDRASGRMLHRLSGLPDLIAHLTFSPDGKYLAVSLTTGGLRVYQTGSWQQIGADADYSSSSDGADFDGNGRLVTTSLDGLIRLYALGQSGLRLIAKKKADGGKKPYAVKFSPDKTKIAVGFTDSSNLNVLSATDLNLLYQPETSEVHHGNFGGVAWAPGNTLYAGGEYRNDVIRPIRIWNDGGRGNFKETQASYNTILDLQSLPTGGIVYGTADPAWGMINAKGERTQFVESDIVDYRYDHESFKVSKDGTEIGFGYLGFGRSPARFSVVKHQLDLTSAQNLDSPRTVTNAYNITDWNESFEPKLNDAKLNLGPRERSHRLAITPDDSKFLIATDYFIHLFDRTGKELWKTASHSSAWSVNLSGDGRLAIAAFGDGTIRWYRMTDGQELLAFFPDKDKKRWVLWTPSGYYEASPDAESLIGWSVNNGKDNAADFFPVGQFRSQFYRPDVIERILTTLDETTALQQANEAAGRKQQPTNVAKQLPPVVEILNPRDGAAVSSTTVKIDYSVRTPSGEPVTNIKVLVDGRPVNLERQLERPVAGSTASVTVTIGEKDSEISLIAANRFAPSVPATVRLKWNSKTAAVSSDEFIIKPKLYVLAIGVSKYANPSYNLDFPAKDAEDFAAALLRQKGGLYREVVVKTLTDANATRDNVVDALDWIRTQTTSKDVAMIFFAGHGVNDGLNRYYFCPYNFSLDRQSSTGVGMNEIKTTVENIAGKVVLFVDSCHSGNVFGTAKSRGNLADINGFVNELSSAENGAIIFAASTGRQVSLEDAAWHNGAFTKALVEGLTGKAEIAGKGKVTVNSLDLYVSERVKELTKGQQTPTTAKPATVPDFPVALKQ